MEAKARENKKSEVESRAMRLSVSLSQGLEGYLVLCVFW